MPRLAMLLVVVAHLGVASTPCFGPAAGPFPLRGVDGQAPHPAPAAHGERSAHAGHPGPARLADGRAHHSNEHHPRGDEPPSSHHLSQLGRNHSEPSQAEAVDDDPTLAFAALRAPCLCGCGDRGESPGTASSPRLGFALVPSEPARVPECPQSIDTPTAHRMPEPLADSLDPVPIFS